MEYLSRFAVALFSSLAEAAPYLVIGYLLVALIREYVPRHVLVRYLGGSGHWPVARAIGIGALLPLCSCGSIPLGVGLVRSGAARGTALTLMTSAPAISPVSVILGYTLLGPPLLVAYAATVIGGAFLIGIVGNQWLPHSVSEPGTQPPICDDEHCRPESDECHGRQSHGAKLRGALRWAYWDLGTDVSVDLLIGLAVAAGVVAFVPPEWIVTWLGRQDVWTLLCIVLVSIPVYTCSVPSLLVINSLLAMGASPGAAVAFLVAGPASNFGEINAIRGAMGRRTAAYYMASLVVVAMAGGVITDGVIPDSYSIAALAAEIGGSTAETFNTQPADSLAALARQVPAWHYPFILILAAVLALGIGRRAGQFCKSRLSRSRVDG